MAATKSKQKSKNKNKNKSKQGPELPRLTAENAERHRLYQASVQNVEAEIDFVDATFEEIRGRHARVLREDFCGTGNTSCEWVRRRPDNRAIGLDIDGPTLDWGLEHMVGALNEEQAARVSLLNRDVLQPADAVGVDCVLAMNFSYWLFQTRADLVEYFKSVRESLGEDGVFFQDFYGGSETMEERTDERACELEDGRKFTYIWDQHKYEPVTARMECKIHFKFRDGTRMNNAFEYHWRLWTLREILELLAEAGFSGSTVYWEGDELDSDGDPTGEGNGEYSPTATGEADPAFIVYIVSTK